MISVVIPCFNSAAFVRDAVASVVAQTRRDLEIVLVDDGSTDDTPALIAALVAEYRGIEIAAVTRRSGGTAAARNTGIERARGRYILPLDADDLLAPDALDALAGALDDHDDIAVAFPDRRDFGALDGVAVAGRFEVSRLKYFNQIPYCSMFRRQVWERVGGFRTNVSGFDDWDFWLAAAGCGFRGHHVARALLLHRRHHDSQLGRIVADYERLFATIILNNGDLYSEAERVAASRFLATSEPAALLRGSKLIFTQHYPLPPRPGHE